MSRARIRSIKPEIWDDEEFGTVSIEAQALFIGLITRADDEGRLRGSARRVRAEIWPYKVEITAETVGQWLEELADARLIVRYEHDGRALIALPGWTDHQQVPRPSPSKYPAPQDCMRSHEDSGGLMRPHEASCKCRRRHEASCICMRPHAGREQEQEQEQEQESVPDSVEFAELDRPSNHDGSELHRQAIALLDYWRQRCNHPKAKASRDRVAKIKARLRDDRYTPAQIRTAIDGAARAAFVNDAGQTFDDIELICRNASKLESFIRRGANTRQPSSEYNVAAMSAKGTAP